MTADPEWQELYRVAPLELRLEELRRGIDAAEKAIQQRMAALKQHDFSSAQESQALEDALRGLRVLATTECQTPASQRSDLATGEVAS